MTENAHATVHGTPGEGARLAGIARAVWPLLAAALLCGYVAGVVAGWQRFGTAAAGATMVVLAVALLAGAQLCRRRLEAFFKGAAGEERVGHVLARLPGAYHVFHSVAVGGGVAMWRGGDLDHVVVGPGGLFVIETKNWQGQVTLRGGELLLDGQAPRRPPLAQVLAGCLALRTRLASVGAPDVAPVPIVCLASDRFADGVTTIGGVTICNASELPRVLSAPRERGVAPNGGSSPPTVGAVVATDELAACLERLRAD